MSGSTSNSNYIGSGSDTFTLDMAEDQAQGTDAQFTVSVDGQQIGGRQTVTTSHSSGQSEAFTFAGNWAPGQHVVTVTFANNWIFPGASGDRNLYINGVTYDGQTVSSSTTPIYQSPLVPPNSTQGNVYGNANYLVNDTTSIPSGSGSNSTTTPAPVTVGSGSDTLVLNMAENAYNGDAQFTVAVDGKQIGGTQTTSADFDAGQSQEFDVKGNFGSGSHTVSVTFLNDAIGGVYPSGTPYGLAGSGVDSQDRNLYVMGMSLDGGAPASGTPWEQGGDGTQNFTVTAGSNPSETGAGSGSFASDGAPATSNNAAIPAGALSASSTSSGSSSGMSFIASPTTSAAVTSTSTPTATTGSTNAGSTTSTPASTVSGATTTTQDFSVSPTPSSSSSTDTSSSGSISSSTSFPTTHVAGSFHHFHH